MLTSIIRKSLWLIGVLLFPVTFIYFSPYLAVVGSAHGVAAAGLITWLAVLVSSPLAARGSCSYGCPLGGMQMCVDAVRAEPLVRLRRLHLVKYVLFGLWVVLILLFAIRAGGYHRVDFFYRISGLAYEPLAYVFLVLFVLMAVLPAIFLGKHAFCRYFCFFSPLSMAGWKLANLFNLPILHVRVARRNACIRCRRCDRDCPMSLPVLRYVAEGKITDVECFACGNCIAACPTGVLCYAYGRNRKLKGQEEKVSDC